MPAALAIEISTLGNFVLHNKFCTSGMLLSKNVWTERKTAFQPNCALSCFLLSLHLFHTSILRLAAETSFLFFYFTCLLAFAADFSVILQLLVERMLHHCGKSLVSVFLPINRSDCFMSPKSTALRRNTMEFWKAIPVFLPTSSVCVCV